MVDEEIFVTLDQNWIDPGKEDSAQNTAQLLRRPRLAEGARCRMVAVTLKYKESQMHEASNKDWTWGLGVGSDTSRDG